MNRKLLSERKLIWKALSVLYLDNELDQQELVQISEVLSNSNFTLTELNEIDLYEVFPVLHVNLWSPAGEWTGFNGEWLYEQCVQQYLKRDSKWRQIIIKIKNRFHCKWRREYWDEIENRLNLNRGSNEKNKI